MRYEDIRKQVIDGCFDMQKKNLIRGTSGNISIRCDENLFAISPSSIPYEKLTTNMIPLVDMEGNVVESSARPSSELPMHLTILRARPDVNCIVHTHSKFSTILSILKMELPICTIPLLFYAPNPAPIVPFELPGSEELGQAVVKGLGKDGQAVIMEQHGLLAVGESLEKAMTCCEYIEEGAEIAYYCRLAADEVRAIPNDKVEKMMEILSTGRAL